MRIGLISLSLAAALVVVLLSTRCCMSPPQGPTPGAQSGQPAASARNPLWAAPLERPGLPNLHKVSDDLYRGAQPAPEGFPELKKMGIKMVVNLRADHSDAEEISGTGLGYVSIPMHAWHPEDEDVIRFLQVVADPAKTPVFVHCQYGADRTGMIIASYRIAVEGWTVEEAVDEMINGGFKFHPWWRGTLVGYLKELDFAKIKKEAGLKEPSAAAAKLGAPKPELTIP
jgi:protein tyrosine phosphatase (PTP) superfamily phosphohydrolase (DUF442 family)